MRRVIGMRDHIVPRGQMAPRINHPQRARVAHARAASGACGGHLCSEHPSRAALGPRRRGEPGRGRAGSSLACRRGRTKRSVWVWGFVIACAREVNVVHLLGSAGAVPGAGRKAGGCRGGGHAEGPYPALLLQLGRPRPALEQQSRRCWLLFED